MFQKNYRLREVLMNLSKNPNQIGNDRLMGPGLTTFLALYHIAIALFLIYFHCRIWPASVPEESSALEVISLFRGIISISVSWEVRLILIVVSAGALGSFIQGASSLIRHAGEKKLLYRYTWWYILRPFIGSALALIFYFVIRGGFLSVSAGAEAISHFGIAAMAGIVGMFSRYAIDKLREVFTTLFAVTTKAPGEEKSQEELTEVTPEKEKENTEVTGKT
jgi:hypothetical protein